VFAATLLLIVGTLNIIEDERALGT